MGFEKTWAGGGEARLKAARMPAEAVAARPRPIARLNRRASPEAERPVLGRRRAAGRQADGAQMRGSPPSRSNWATGRPSHGVAKPADLRHPGGQVAWPKPRSRRSACDQGEPSRRARSLHGNTGCRFAASDTKRHAEEIARWCEARVETRHGRSTSTLPAAIIPAPSIISANRLARRKVPTSEDGHRRGLSHPRRRRLRPGCGTCPRLFATSRRDDAPHTSKPCSRPIFRAAPRLTRGSTRSPVATKFPRSADVRGVPRHELDRCRPPLPLIVPESAPFTDDQRVWLNGFFAGLAGRRFSALSPQDAVRR